ncbi:MAG: CSLREA domain-containing protein [Chloroflexota bacterium]
MPWMRRCRRMVGAGSMLLAGLVAAGAWVPVPVHSAISSAIVVNTTLDVAVANDGRCSLREAITSANTNAVSGAVLGECPPGTTGVDPITFTALAGPIVLGSSLPAITSDLIIDGSTAGAPIIIDGAGVSRPFTATAGTVTLRGITIRNGHAASGGGAVSATSPLALEQVAIEDSSGTTGGGIYASASLVMTDVTISGCAASSGGGGVYLASPAVGTVTRLTASGNTAPTGGGIYIEYGAHIGNMSASTFATNVALGSGGAIESLGSVYMLASTTFLDNSAENGGAIDVVLGAGIDVRDSVFRGNQASENGGAISATGAVQSVRSSFVGNAADAAGGALWTNWQAILIQVTFSGNTAPQGGAVRGDSPQLYGVTVVGNTTTGPNSAAVHASYGNSDFVNDLVVGNTGGDAITSGGSVHSSSLAIPAGLAIGDIVVPGGAKDNGGPTPTVALTANTTTNPAVDAGASDWCQATFGGVDQRGQPRPVGACDIGAFELDRVAPTVTAPVADVATKTRMSGSSIPVRVAWTGSSAPGGTGIGAWFLARSLNGAAYAPICGTLHLPACTTSLASGATARYRSRAANGDGTLSATATGPSIKAALVQQTASTLRWSGSWTTSRTASASGGSMRSSSRAGASVSYTFTGRNIALLTTRAAGRGKARIYINGSLKATVDLGGATSYRYIAWQLRFSTSATRTIKVVVVGTSGRPRVDIDGFIVLK